MKIYIASSWRNRHAVEMLTDMLRELGHTVISFVEKANRVDPASLAGGLAEWIASDEGEERFEYDTNGATTADIVIYIGPSGTDAWAEVGAAWQANRVVVGLWAKGEPAGLMRRMMATWFTNYRDLLREIGEQG